MSYKSLLLSITIAILSIVTAELHASCNEVESIQSRLGLEKITIEEVINQALVEHPAIASGQLAFENSLDAITIARSQRYPQTYASLTYGYTRAILGGVTGSIEARKAELGTSLLLFDFGNSKNQIKAAQSRSMEAQASVDNKKNIIALAAVESFTDVLEKRIALDFGRQAYEDFRSIKYELTNSGISNETDLNVILSRKQGICDVVKSTLAEENGAVNYYESVLDYKPTNIFLEIPKEITIETNLDLALKKAMDNNPRYLQSKFNVASAKSTYASAKKSGHPKIYADSSFKTKDQFSDQFSDYSTDEFYIGGTIKIPITDGGSRKAKRKQAGRGVLIAENSMEEVKRALRRQVSDLVFNLQNTKQRISELKGVVDSSAVAYKEMRTQLISGGTVNSQLLRNMVDERQRLYEAQIRLNSQRYILVMDSYSLLALQGPIKVRY